MKILLSMGFWLIALASMSAPYVTNVVAKSRMPWNGLVDVSYEIVGSTNGLEGVYGQLTATDRTRGKTYVASTFEKKIDLSEGKHTAIWNMAADNSFTSKDVVFNLSIHVPALYCVIDLSGGPTATSYPVEELYAIPDGGWTDEYKTTKLVMRWCPAGTDPLGRYTLTKAFYIGVFEITQKQWYLVGVDIRNNSIESRGSGDMYPACGGCTYDYIRGSNEGSHWPTSSAVDLTSFVGKLRSKTGLNGLDLPTEAQWEYACRAGTKSAYYWGDTLDDTHGWYQGSGGTHEAGKKEPNLWGIYDMSGNVWEWCLDAWSSSLPTGTDPRGAAEAKSHVIRGGSCCQEGSYGTSASRDSWNNSINGGDAIGFRLCRTLP